MLKLGWLLAGQQTPLHVVQNWFEALKARVPVD